MREAKAGSVATLLVWVLRSLPEETVKVVIDDFIDRVEDKVAAAPSGTGRAVLRVLEILRRIIDVPDDIGGDED